MQSGARSAPGEFGVFGVQKQQNHRESSTVLFNKNAVASEKNANRFKKKRSRVAGCNHRKGRSKKRQNKTGRFRGHESSIPRFYFRVEHVLLKGKGVYGTWRKL